MFVTAIDGSIQVVGWVLCHMLLMHISAGFLKGGSKECQFICREGWVRWNNSTKGPRVENNSTSSSLLYLKVKVNLIVTVLIHLSLSAVVHSFSFSLPFEGRWCLLNPPTRPEPVKSCNLIQFDHLKNARLAADTNQDIPNFSICLWNLSINDLWSRNKISNKHMVCFVIYMFWKCLLSFMEVRKSGQNSHYLPLVVCSKQWLLLVKLLHPKQRLMAHNIWHNY